MHSGFFHEFFNHPGMHSHEDDEPVDTDKFYDTLGISKDATEKQIKKAYLKKARDLHPDRHPDETEKYQQLFQEVQRAYEVLSDPQKRSTYDKFGEQGLRRGGGGGGGVDDIISQMFNPGGRRQQRNDGPRKSPPIKEALSVSLEDLYKGATKKLRIKRLTSESGTSECSRCNGEGSVTVVQHMGPMVLQSRRPCTQCNGMGYRLKERYVEIDVHIPPGGRNKESITISGEGNRFPNHANGDVIVILQQEKHDIFTRQGADLGMSHTLTLREALCGYTIILKHVSGRTLIIKSKENEIVQPGSLKRCFTWGMPQRYATHVKGHLYINMSVKLPVSGSLSHDAISEFARILPEPERKTETNESSPRESNTSNRRKSRKKPKQKKRKNKKKSSDRMDLDEDFVEEVIADDIDGDPHATPASARSAYDEDDDETEGVQCRQM